MNYLEIPSHWLDRRLVNALYFYSTTFLAQQQSAVVIRQTAPEKTKRFLRLGVQSFFCCNPPLHLWLRKKERASGVNRGKRISQEKLSCRIDKKGHGWLVHDPAYYYKDVRRNGQSVTLTVYRSQGFYFGLIVRPEGSPGSVTCTQPRRRLFDAQRAIEDLSRRRV